MADSPAMELIDAVRAWLEGGVMAEPVTDEAWRLAELHGVGGILGLYRLQRGETTSAPVRRYFSTALAYERARRVLGRVVDAARTEAIPVVLVKGPALAVQVYGDGGLRGFGDLDLLVADRSAAMTLVTKLGGTVADMEGGDIITALRNPGKMVTTVDGFELEVLYPVDEPSDAMLDLLSAHRELLRVPTSVDELCDPEPAFHLVFLLLHMLTNHFCARLIWFTDIALFVRTQSERIDWRFVEAELERLGMTSAAEAVFRFCERHLDRSLSRRVARRMARNPRFLARMTDAEVVMARTMGVQYVGGMQRVAVQFAYLGCYFLLGDRGRSNPARYSVARVRRALSRIVRFPGCVVALPVWVIARTAAWVTEHALLGLFGTRNRTEERRCVAVS